MPSEGSQLNLMLYQCFHFVKSPPSSRNFTRMLFHFASFPGRCHAGCSAWVHSPVNSTVSDDLQGPSGLSRSVCLVAFYSRCTEQALMDVRTQHPREGASLSSSPSDSVTLQFLLERLISIILTKYEKENVCLQHVACRQSLQEISVFSQVVAIQKWSWDILIYHIYVPIKTLLQNNVVCLKLSQNMK